MNADVKLLLLVHIIYTPLMSSTTLVFLFITFWCFVFTYALMQLNLVCFAQGRVFFKPWLPLSSCQICVCLLQQLWYFFMAQKMFCLCLRCHKNGVM